ncbi:MAG: Bax inhibitor-1/YccA family protein [Gammaproteobacteria bacterium]|jgi:modulator of FtsH protease
MNENPTVVTRRSEESILATNNVLKNTYLLLSMTLLFSAAMSVVAVITNASFMSAIVCNIAGIVLVWFVIPKYRNSVAALPLTFLFVGLLGYGMGPMLSHYLTMFSNGAELIGTALAGTGVIFLGLSGYVLTTRKDFSFLGGFLIVGFLVMLGAILVNIFLQIPALQLAISSVMIMIMSGFILYDTSRIIHGGERNYVMATISLYLNIVIMFQHLLRLLAAFSGED